MALSNTILNKRSCRDKFLAVAIVTALGVSACSGHEVSKSPASVAQRSIAGSTGNQGWYSSEQALQGAAIFKNKCAVCHGDKLQGGAGPPLAGNQFFLRYRGKPLAALWSVVHTQMPLNAPGSKWGCIAS